MAANSEISFNMCYQGIIYSKFSTFVKPVGIPNFSKRHIQMKSVYRTRFQILNLKKSILKYLIELVSKESNHLVAILHVYAGVLNFMKYFFFCYHFSKRKWKYFYTFNLFIVKSLQKEHKSPTMTPNLPE